jgi:hypothetical protein
MGRDVRATPPAATGKSSTGPGVGSDNVSENLKKIPLWFGTFGISSVLLNRLLSGIAAVSDAGSSQSRADVLAIVLSAACILTGLQWSSIKARVYPKVDQGGVEMAYFDEERLGKTATSEVQWCYRSLQDTSSVCGLVLFYRGKCVAQLGFASGDQTKTGGNAELGPMLAQVLEQDKGNYIPNLKVYPGKIEFTYLPNTVQAMIMQPLGEDGVMLVCGDTQRGFTKVDQSWISTIAEKLDVTLQSNSMDGKD